jgi:hypothetical protein
VTKFKGLLEATRIHRPNTEEEGFLKWLPNPDIAASAVIQFYRPLPSMNVANGFSVASAAEPRIYLF